MCKAVVESNLETGSQIGKGLNNGILYLMAVPYIAIFSFAIFWYFQKKSTNTHRLKNFINLLLLIAFSFSSIAQEKWDLQKC